MGNTAAISAKTCYCDCCAVTESSNLRRSPLQSSATAVGHSNETQLVRNKFDSSHQLKTAVDSNTDKMSECSRKIQPMDTPNQKGTNDGYSLGPGFNTFRGTDFVKDGRLNKGLAYSIDERQKLGILGLVPPAVQTQEQQLEQAKANLDRLTVPLDKYVYLSNLSESNEKLFYKLLMSNVQEYMPLVYTPTVGEACQKFSLLFQKPPRGLFITIHDKGHVYDVLRNWPVEDIRVIVVTDGERILGLGDLGANGMGIPVGKLSLYTALAGVKPSQCLPITLDVGTNTESILKDPLYIGLRQKRVTGKEYDDFIEEFMQAVVRRFGRNCLIQFEDFGNSNAFRLLEKYRNNYCTFNDDIQGTASVAVAGLLAGMRLLKTRLSDHTILFQGAGEASLGIAQLCVMAMQKEGTSEQDAKDKIWMVDSKGLIVIDRPEGGVTGHKKLFAKNHQPIKDLYSAVQKVKPSILIGASAIGGAFTREIITEMGKNNKSPVIFALSNPTSKAECTAEQAYNYTDGRAIFASGSPFDTVVYQGKRFEPGQGNNAYVFPGVGLGVICAGASTISDELFLMSAQTLADLVQESDLEVGRLYPPLQSITQCSVKIATNVMKAAYQTGVATTFPEPCDYEEYVKCQMYSTDYESTVPPTYSYPKN
ncbi:NADP-dependent malic enzyme-like isoform X1 [Planococcus citri]|uniref:NADP-dependent malic enzyme-like isoform X1 n=1 Tax=Planococcus citri TaxID=170843 RepID=UPI0031F9620A